MVSFRTVEKGVNFTFDAALVRNIADYSAPIIAPERRVAGWKVKVEHVLLSDQIIPLFRFHAALPDFFVQPCAKLGVGHLVKSLWSGAEVVSFEGGLPAGTAGGPSTAAGTQSSGIPA